MQGSSLASMDYKKEWSNYPSEFEGSDFKLWIWVDFKEKDDLSILYVNDQESVGEQIRIFWYGSSGLQEEDYQNKY